MKEMREKIKAYCYEYLNRFMGKEILIKTDSESYDYNIKCDNMNILIQVYNRELYFHVSPFNEESNGVSVYNILEFREEEIGKKIEPNYFHEIENLDECIDKQLNLFFSIMSKYYNIIADFCDKKKYENNRTELREFVIKKNPQLFKTVSG